jgi:hypothetical protein
MLISPFKMHKRRLRDSLSLALVLNHQKATREPAIVHAQNVGNMKQSRPMLLTHTVS